MRLSTSRRRPSSLPRTCPPDTAAVSTWSAVLARSSEARSSTRSSRSTGRGGGAWPTSCSASARSCSTMAWSRSTAVIAWASCAAGSGEAALVSSSTRTDASGLRSSWLASATSWRSRPAAASSRSSMSFMVTASRSISSPLSGTGTRVERCRSLISPTVVRIASTGRSARPTPIQTIRATPAVRSGTTSSDPRRTERAAASACSSERATTSHCSSPAPNGVTRTRSSPSAGSSIER